MKPTLPTTIMDVTQDNLHQCVSLGCFACQKTFAPGDITQWVKELDGTMTARCPHCGIDTVMGSTVPMEEMPKDAFANMLAKTFRERLQVDKG